MSFDRREIIKLLSVGIAGGVVGTLKGTAVPVAETAPIIDSKQYEGANLSNWEVALGDSIYSCPGEPTITLADIETIHQSTHSELRANIVPRKIRTHNITFKRFIDDTAFNFIHTCGYKFRLPYLPQKDTNTTINGQTIEGGIFVWDGVTENRDRGIAFQWVINPWAAGSINTWNGTNWNKVGSMDLDTKWHEVSMAVDFQRELTALKIDGNPIPTIFSRTEKAGWDPNIAARLQAEIVSVDIEGNCNMEALHKAEFKDWYWYWESARSCKTHLPLIMNSN